MNKDEFLKRLSEVAEWHIPMLGPNGCYSVAKGRERKVEHPGPITPEELEEMSETEVKRYYDQLMAWRESQPNPSVHPEIISVKIQPVDCMDCGRHCPAGRKTQIKLHESGDRHWRELCKECNLYRDPLTGQFTLEPHIAHAYFTQFYKPKLGKYKSKYQPDLKPKEKAVRPNRKLKLTKSQIMEKIIAEGSWETRETDDSITRTFVPKK